MPLRVLTRIYATETRQALAARPLWCVDVRPGEAP